MTRSNLWFLELLGLVLVSVTACEQTPVTYVDEFTVGGHTFPVAVRDVNGVDVRYVRGLVVFTTNPDVTIEQLQPMVGNFLGEILRLSELSEPKELDVMMRIALWMDPFEVAAELGHSPLIKYAEPVYLGIPGGP